MTTRLTWRQLRLLDWLRDPHHDSLPQHAAIQWRAAMWPVSVLARLSGVATPYTYARCRRDLEALRAQGYVDTIIPGRWTLTEDLEVSHGLRSGNFSPPSEGAGSPCRYQRWYLEGAGSPSPRSSQ